MMKKLSIYIFLASLGLFFNCNNRSGDPPSTAFQSFDQQQVRLEGEFGRRMDLIMNTNIPNIDIENDFLEHFRNKSAEPDVRDGFVGIGMLLDAIVGLAYYSGDSDMINRKQYITDELIKTQENDGYIGIFSKKSRQQGWDTHEGGYIILALTNDYLLFEETESLAAAIKYADYMIDRKVEQMTGIDEAFFQLYHVTNDRKYVDYCINEMGLHELYFRMQHHTRHVYGHMERALMQLKLFEIEPDEKLLYKPHVAVEFLVNMDALDIIGGSGMWEHFNTTHEGHDANDESCATAYIIWLMNDLIKAEGISFYGDIMERSIYNALFAAMSPTGDSIRYFTDFESAKEYYPDDYFCCPNNYRRIISDLPDLIYYKSDKGIAVNLYSNSQISFKLINQNVDIRQVTDYPSSGEVKIYVEPEVKSEFEIKVRIPLWCENPSISVNGKMLPEKPQTGDFYAITREWKKGDEIQLSLPMEYRLVSGRGKQWEKVALMRGPVVYGVSNEINPMVSEQVDLMIDPKSFSEPIHDESFRPDGLKCKAVSSDKDKPEITFTEFIDPSGIKTFFHLSERSSLVEEDEFVTKQY